MRILITGAAGFIGRALAARIIEQDGLGTGFASLERLVVCDTRLGDVTPAATGRIEGDLADPAVCAAALACEPDVVFHLAAVPGGAAEANYDLGKRVNIDAAMALAEMLRNRANRPRLVMSSSIAVFGSPLPSIVDDDTPPSPALSYGAQKLMLEIHLTDLARRGEIDARLVRLPGIVARPRQAGGHISAYMSNVFHAVAAGERFTCPVGPNAMAWFMSATCVVDNLLHAARLAPDAMITRVLTLPALRLSMADLVAAIGDATDQPADRLVGYEPVPAIEAQFGSYPPLLTPRADALGFRHDGNAAALVRRALAHAGIATRR